MSEFLREVSALSAAEIAAVNRMVAKAETLLTRGERTSSGAFLKRGPWAIYGGPQPEGGARLVIEHEGQDVFDVTWPKPGDPGRVLLDVPGPWRTAFSAWRVYDA